MFVLLKLYFVFYITKLSWCASLIRTDPRLQNHHTTLHKS